MLASELQILGQASDASTGVYLVALTQTSAIVDAGMRANPAVVADNNIALDICERLDGHIVANLGIGVNIS
jgi:hypothetical protein